MRNSFRRILSKSTRYRPDAVLLNSFHRLSRLIVFAGMTTYLPSVTSSTSKGVTSWRKIWPTLALSQSKPSILSSTTSVYTIDVYTVREKPGTDWTFPVTLGEGPPCPRARARRHRTGLPEYPVPGWKGSWQGVSGTGSFRDRLRN